MSADIEPHLDGLFGYAYALTQHQHDAQDLVQICAMKMLSAKHVPTIEPDLQRWLYRVLKNAFIDQHRAAVRRSSQPFDDETNYNLQDLYQPDRTMINQLTVWQAMRSLSVEHREIVALIDIAGFNYSEASNLLAVPAGTVMSRLSRARKSLLVTITRDEKVASASNVHQFLINESSRVR